MNDELEDRDLSHLNDAEREAYLHRGNKDNLSFFTALYCAGIGFVGVVTIFQEISTLHLIGIVKAIGFIAFGFWARSWSRIACVLLLVWHVWLNQQYAGANRILLKAMFWVPAALFLFGIFHASGRASLIAKAEQGPTEL